MTPTPANPVPTSPARPSARPPTQAPPNQTPTSPPQPEIPANPNASAAAMRLPDLLTGSLNGNPSLAEAQTRVLAARAKVATAQAQRRFQVQWNPSASASNTDVIQGPPSHETFGTLENTFHAPMPWGRRFGAAQSQAEADLRAAEAAYRRIRLETVLSVQNAYIELLRAQELRAVAGESLRQADRQLSDAKIRAEAGDAPQLDAIRSQVPVSNARAALLAAQNREVLARRTLNVLFRLPGESAAASLEALPIPVMPAFSLEEAENRAEAHAPELEEAEATRQSAEAAIEVARRSREPAYEFQASDIRSSDKTGFSRQDTLLFTVTLPLSDGGAARAAIQEKQAGLQGTQFAMDSARQTVRAAVDAAYLNVSTLLQQLSANQEAARVAETSLNLTREGYLAGLYSVRDVLDAQTALSQARSAVVQTTYDAQASLAALTRAMGEETP